MNGLLDHGAIMAAMKETENARMKKEADIAARKAAQKLPWSEDEIERLLLAEKMFPKKEKGSDDEYESDEEEREKKRLRKKGGMAEPPERDAEGVLRYEKRDRWDRIAAYVGKVRTYRDCHNKVNELRKDRKEEKLRLAREEKERIEAERIANLTLDDFTDEQGRYVANDVLERVESLTKQRTTEEMQAFVDKYPIDALFHTFDLDNSGEIEFDEFKKMLPVLGVHLPEAKALRFFTSCDLDGSGQIDKQEFLVALLSAQGVIEDPKQNINSEEYTVLSPKDAFDLFDADGSGLIEYGEFAALLEYVNIHVDEKESRKMFDRFDTDFSGQLDLLEFKLAWLQLVDVKQQCKAHKVPISMLDTRSDLMEKLMRKLDEEEKTEDVSVDNAMRYLAYLEEQKKIEREQHIAEMRTREYWKGRSMTEWNRDEIAEGLKVIGFPAVGKRHELLDQIKSFVNDPDDIKGWIFDVVDHVCDLQERGLEMWGGVYVVGRGTNGQLGLGPEVQSLSEPRCIEELCSKAVSSVYSGFSAEIAYCSNTAAQVWLLGGAKTGPVPFPDIERKKLWYVTEVSIFNSQPLKAISVGRMHGLAVTDKGDLYSWGSNAHGQLGLIGGSDLTYNSMKPEVDVLVKKIPLGGSYLDPDGSPTKKIEKQTHDTSGQPILDQSYHEPGQERENAAKDEKQLYGMGVLMSNGSQCMGVQTLAGRIVRHSGDGKTVVRDMTGRRTFFWDTESFLKEPDKEWPTLIEFLASLGPCSCPSAGPTHSAVTMQGRLYSWGAAGSNDTLLGRSLVDRQPLGAPWSTHSPTPAIVKFPPGIKIKKVSCGSSHTAVITDEGRLLSWGSGDGARSLKPTKHEVIIAGKARRTLDIACGAWHSLALLHADGTEDDGDEAGWVVSWGSGRFGQLGRGVEPDEQQFIEPRPVFHLGGQTGMMTTKVACGMYHNAALTTGGTIWTWGWNRFGCLGRKTLNEFSDGHLRGTPDAQQVGAIPNIMKGVGVYPRGHVISVACGNDYIIFCTKPWTGPHPKNYLDLSHAAAMIIQAVYKKYRGKQRYMAEMKKDYLKIWNVPENKWYYYNVKKKKKYYRLPKKLNNDHGIRVVKGARYRPDEMTKNEKILASGDFKDGHPGNPCDDWAIILSDPTLHDDPYRRIDVLRETVAPVKPSEDDVMKRNFGKLAYEVQQYTGARKVPQSPHSETDEDPLDELLIDILNPNCRLCSICTRRGGWKPGAVRPFYCERCGHHKILHGKRKVPMSRFEAAMKIQKMWRIKSARLFMLNILSLQYEKRYDHSTMSYFYYNRRQETSQWYKPLLFGETYDIPVTGKDWHDYAPKEKFPSRKKLEDAPLSRFALGPEDQPVDEAEVSATAEAMTDKERKKYLKHIKQRERQRKKRAKEREDLAASFLQNKWRGYIAKRNIRKSIHSLYERVWSSEHKMFFYYNVKTYRSQWTKPILLGPDDLTPRFYE